MPRVTLPDGSRYRLRDAPQWTVDPRPAASRTAYAAAHVVGAEPLPGHRPVIDWAATLAFRRHLWRHGLGVADAMDTAQRGGGLDWADTRELIRRSGAEARACGGRLACGAGTDQLPGARRATLKDVVGAYEEQLEVVEGAGATPILMASRALAATARDAEDYHDAYDVVLDQVGRPVILHWLGDMFDPALRGYWGSTDLDEAAEVVLAL